MKKQNWKNSRDTATLTCTSTQYKNTVIFIHIVDLAVTNVQQQYSYSMCVNILPFYFPALPLPLPLPAFASFMWEIFPAPCGGHFLHFPLGAAQSAYHFSPTKKVNFSIFFM